MDSPQRRVRVVIVDDDALVRAALRLILESDSGVTVLGEGADGRSGYDAARSLRPDVVLMDLHMPGTDGVWATAQIAANCPDTKVLVLTAFDTDAMVAAALHAGATGFLLKDSAPEIIFRAVHAAADGQRAFSGSVLDRLVEAAVEATPQRRAFPETSPTGNARSPCSWLRAWVMARSLRSSSSAPALSRPTSPPCWTSSASPTGSSSPWPWPSASSTTSLAEPAAADPMTPTPAQQTGA